MKWGDLGLFIQRVDCIRYLQQQTMWTTMGKHLTILTERNPWDCQIHHDPCLCFPCFLMHSMNWSMNSSRPDESSLSKMWKRQVSPKTSNSFSRKIRLFKKKKKASISSTLGKIRSVILVCSPQKQVLILSMCVLHKTPSRQALQESFCLTVTVWWDKHI